MSQASEPSVTLDDVLSAVATKRVPLAAELAGYLVLTIAEGTDTNSGEIEPTQVFLSEGGTVGVVRSRRDGNAEASLRSLLFQLLESSGSQTPALIASARRPSGASVRNFESELEAALIPLNRAAARRALARLAREVRRVAHGVGRNAGLTPAPTRTVANVAARSTEVSTPDFLPRESSTSTSSRKDARVATSSLPNEAKESGEPSALPASMPGRADSSPKVSDSVSHLVERFQVSGPQAPVEHARAMKALTGLTPTPPPARADIPEVEADLEELLAVVKVPPPVPSSRHSSGATKATSPMVTPTFTTSQASADPTITVGVSPSESTREAIHDGTSTSTVPTALPLGAATLPTDQAAPSEASRRRSKGRLRFALTLIATVTTGALVIVAKYNHSTDSPSLPASSVRPPQQDTTEGLAQVAHPNGPANCSATLTVSNAPDGSEVLVRVGTAPVDVPRMPVGPRLEFVATAEGFEPKRAVIPASAAWDQTSDRLSHFRLNIPLDAKTGAEDRPSLWPPAAPGSEVGGVGPAGTVHISVTPEGAEVWRLTGIGPLARITHLPCDSDIDVLVAGPTTFRSKLHVSSGDFVNDEGSSNGPSKSAVVQVLPN